MPRLSYEAFGNALIAKHREVLLKLAREAAQAEEIAQHERGDDLVLGNGAVITAVVDGYQVKVAYFTDDIIEHLKLLRLSKAPKTA